MMNRDLRIFLSIIAALFIAGGALAYGAATPTAPQASPSSTPQPTLSKSQLEKRLESERSTIIGVLTAAYPKIEGDYTISKGQLFDKGQWYGTTLMYQGKDTLNRDTLRVLLQKKNGIWELRTAPPTIILSAVEYPDVPKSVLETINKPVSLP